VALAKAKGHHGNPWDQGHHGCGYAGDLPSGYVK
jgi:hypothetical protein